MLYQTFAKHKWQTALLCTLTHFFTHRLCNLGSDWCEMNCAKKCYEKPPCELPHLHSGTAFKLKSLPWALAWAMLQSCLYLVRYLSDLDSDVLTSVLAHHHGLLWCCGLFAKSDFHHQTCCAVLPWVLCDYTPCQRVWSCACQSCCCPRLQTHHPMWSSPLPGAFWSLWWIFTPLVLSHFKSIYL